MSDARVEWYGDEVVAQVDSGMTDALSVTGAYMVGAVRAEITAQDLIDTGNLRASIDHEPAGPDREKVGTNVHYAIYLEYGTSSMGAKAFMRRSIEDGTNKSNVAKLAAASLRGAI